MRDIDVDHQLAEERTPDAPDGHGDLTRGMGVDGDGIPERCRLGLGPGHGGGFPPRKRRQGEQVSCRVVHADVAEGSEHEDAGGAQPGHLLGVGQVAGRQCGDDGRASCYRGDDPDRVVPRLLLLEARCLPDGRDTDEGPVLYFAGGHARCPEQAEGGKGGRHEHGHGGP